MASHCCSCTAPRAKCCRCSCVKTGQPCLNCRPGDRGQCSNPCRPTVPHRVSLKRVADDTDEQLVDDVSPPDSLDRTHQSTIDAESSRLLPVSVLGLSDDISLSVGTCHAPSHDATTEGHYFDSHNVNNILSLSYGSCLVENNSNAEPRWAEWTSHWKNITQLSGLH